MTGYHPVVSGFNVQCVDLLESFQNEYAEICAVQYTKVYCEFEPVLYCMQEMASHTVHAVCLIWLLRACR
jgi:hypothetical protein